MENRTLKQLLMSSSYFVLNKQIVKAIGIEAGFLLTTLIEASDGLANDDGWFYKTAPSLEEETGLSNHKQSKIIEELTKLGILEQENKGMPMKRYFRINFNKIEELVFKIQDLKNSKPSIEENKKQGFKNFECKDLKNSNACIEKISNNIITNNNNLNKELNNNNLIEIGEKVVINSNGALQQEIKMLLGVRKIKIFDIIKLNKPIERIKEVIVYCDKNNKSDGYLFKALRDDWELIEHTDNYNKGYNLTKPKEAYKELV